MWMRKTAYITNEYVFIPFREKNIGQNVLTSLLNIKIWLYQMTWKRVTHPPQNELAFCSDEWIASFTVSDSQPNLRASFTHKRRLTNSLQKQILHISHFPSQYNLASPTNYHIRKTQRSAPLQMLFLFDQSFSYFFPFSDESWSL